VSGTAAGGTDVSVGGTAAVQPVRTPLGLAAAIALTAVAGLVLSGAPQIVLRYAHGTLL
jgi:NADH-quinone oxidoreductase subunit N